MKVSKERMTEHREKIISAASKRFRELGYDGVSVSDVMKEAGLTHGGFYGHFASKEELEAIASERAISKSLARWEKVIEESKEDPLETLAATYLNAQHRNAPGSGCLFAALGSDVPRQPMSVRKTVAEGLERFLILIEGIVPGKRGTRRRKAIAASAALVGGMVLARSVDDPELSNEILQAVADSLAQ